MALQTFTAGQVLTAAQVTALQSNDFNQTVSTKTANYTLVVGDRGTRLVGNGTSITFTVDNSIFSAGDTLKIHNINSTALTIAAGAGVTINAAAGLTISQWQEAVLYATSASSFILFESTASSAQGLTLINTTSFSGVVTQSISDVFSTTYDNYKLVLRLSSAGASGNLNFRFRVSGADDTANEYYSGFSFDRFTNATGNGGGNPLTAFVLPAMTSGGTLFSFDLDVFDPFKSTIGTLISYHGLGQDVTSGYSHVGAGFHNVVSSFTGFTLINTGGNLGTGTISVYGFNK